MNYRPEIDGLRALAVLPVMLFHAGFETFSGGYVGVDIFFVISGYLITTIIISEMAAGNFTLANFYERRARRILPALFIVMAACLPFVWFWLPASEIDRFGLSLLSATLFVSNIFYWLASTGYFDVQAEQHPLIHLWSLSVEEQYYILFPVFLLLVWRFGLKWILMLLAVAILISLGIAVWGTQASASKETVSGAFFLLPARGWELLVGAFVAIYLHSKTHSENSSFNQLFSLVGVGLLIYSIFSFDKTTPYPSLYTLIPTIGTALVILSTGPRTIVNRLLSVKLFVGIGLVSYSAYLWHQPILVFARFTVLGELEYSVALFLCLASFLLAWVSWKFVESPMRNRTNFSRKSILIFSASGILAYSAIGLILIANNGFSTYKNNLISEKLLQIGIERFEPDNGELWQERLALISDIHGDKDYSINSRVTERRNNFDLSSHKKRLLIVGNSHSNDMLTLFHYSDELLLHFDFARYGTQLHDIDASFFTSDAYRYSEVIMIAARYNAADLEVLHDISSRILNDGKQLVIVDEIFNFKTNGTNTAADYIIAEELENATETTSITLEEIRHKVDSVYTNLYLQNTARREYLQLKQIYEKVKARISEGHPQVVFLNRMDYVCPDDWCLGLTPDGRKTFFDAQHPTVSATVYFGEGLHKTNFYRELVTGLGIEE